MHVVAMATGSDEAAILECMQAGVAQQKVSCWIYKAVLCVHVRDFMKHYWQKHSLQKKSEIKYVSMSLNYFSL